MQYFIYILKLINDTIVFFFTYRNIFRLKDCCNLLNILPGTAILLKQNFKQADRLKTVEEKESSVQSSLADIGVCNLTFSHAQQLLNARVDWPRVL